MRDGFHLALSWCLVTILLPHSVPHPSLAEASSRTLSSSLFRQENTGSLQRWFLGRLGFLPITSLGVNILFLSSVFKDESC